MSYIFLFQQIGQRDGVDALGKMLVTAENVKEQISACKALWVLSFNDKNKEIMKKCSYIVEELKKLKVSRHKVCQGFTI